MAIDDFQKGLRDLGYNPSVAASRVTFPYRIEVGKHIGTQIEIGFEVDPNFPLVPPTGPRIKPRLYPIHPGNDIPHPHGGVHDAQAFGPDWEYWSRPFNGWADLPVDQRSVKTYMRFIRDLFAKIDP